MAGVILEGADGTGKTTLAKKLAEHYGWDICHCTSEDPTDYDFYKQTARKKNVIWDRHTIGELIYPEVFKRTPQIGAEDARLILHYAKESGTKVLVLTSDIGTIKKRLNERGEPYKEVVNNIEWINDRFLFYAEQFNIPIIDTSKIPFDEICKIIEND